ncbi:hypothetical protein [Acetilactobacillus jinshanensis]|uniref:Uncharacterized protein n=1 Tax=Acetilactobacillus jinshanensis TaxID=1720083 RepID=A0A4V1ALJ0_9LACO|nr:hypothetical protein [Acetilactobacillus jinshanensis]QBP17769.1 hypothetical protein ELX58_00960 [Acetilactobacillus jinshanensis]URL60631.1 hypothetical protein HGK75_00985 [uncultured bacterium]
MFKKRYEKKEDKKAIIDIDNFIVTYGEQVLGSRPDLTQTIYKACKGNLKGLDKLFKDQGFGRIHKFVEIAQGYVSDMYELDGKAAEPKVNFIIHQAIAYLGSHAKDLNKWKLA